MKLVSYLREGQDQLAFVVNNIVYDADIVSASLPSHIGLMLHFWADSFPIAKQTNTAIIENKFDIKKGIPLSQIQLMPVVPCPTSIKMPVTHNTNLPYRHHGRR